MLFFFFFFQNCHLNIDKHILILANTPLFMSSSGLPISCMLFSSYFKVMAGGWKKLHGIGEVLHSFTAQ